MSDTNSESVVGAEADEIPDAPVLRRSRNTRSEGELQVCAVVGVVGGLWQAYTCPLPNTLNADGVTADGLLVGFVLAATWSFASMSSVATDELQQFMRRASSSAIQTRCLGYVENPIVEALMLREPIEVGDL